MPKAKKRSPMRILFGIPFAVVLAVGVWWTFPIQAKQQYDAILMDPVGMMSTTTNLPVDSECDQAQFFRLPECTTTRNCSPNNCKNHWPRSLLPATRAFYLAMQPFMNLFQPRNLIFCARACFLQPDHFLRPSSSASRDFSAPLSTKGAGEKTEGGVCANVLLPTRTLVMAKTASALNGGFTVPRNRHSAYIQFPRVCTFGDRLY